MRAASPGRPPLRQGEYGALRDHEHAPELGEPGDDVVRQGVAAPPRALAAVDMSANGMTATEARRCRVPARSGLRQAPVLVGAGSPASAAVWTAGLPWPHRHGCRTSGLAHASGAGSSRGLRLQTACLGSQVLFTLADSTFLRQRLEQRLMNRRSRVPVAATVPGSRTGVRRLTASPVAPGGMPGQPRKRLRCGEPAVEKGLRSISSPSSRSHFEQAGQARLLF